MKKGIQICIMVFLILIILGGGYYICLALEIVPQPAFISNIPVIGSHLGAEPVSEAESSGDEKEPPAVSDDLSQKQKEIDDLQLKVDALQEKLDQSEKTAVSQQETIAELNAEIDQLKNTETEAGRSEASKDMAEYYTEMKAKDAAGILTNLQDEEVISIIQHMPKDTAAEILQNMEKIRAAEITRKRMAAN